MGAVFVQMFVFMVPGVLSTGMVKFLDGELPQLQNWYHVHVHDGSRTYVWTIPPTYPDKPLEKLIMRLNALFVPLGVALMVLGISDQSG